MLDELEAAGIETADFGAFSRSGELFDHARAAPILVRWLPTIEDEGVRESIVRSLTGEREAARRGAVPVLVAEFERPWADSTARWAVGNALATLADAAVADDLIRLLRDRGYGTARQMLCEALRRTGDPRTPEVLIELIEDDEVAGHAVAALRTLGRKNRVVLNEARATLQDLAERPSATPFARKEARRAMNELDAAT
jgi:HEAT repeat protein